ncbi:MAG TPA: type III polyketide synthase [Micromonosporaceae bacterium]
MVEPARAVVAGIGVAHPPSLSQDELWHGFFAQHYAGVTRSLARRVFEHAGVRTRHGVINPAIEDPSHWPTSVRMQRYLTEALPLGKDAVSTALGRAGVPASEIGMLVVCSCTGYATPGLDILLARDLGLPADARRVFIGHMGCYAALPGLGVAADYVALARRPAVLLCVELPSLHVQPPATDPQQVVAHALFSDAAAAAVLVAGGAGRAVTDVAALTDTATADQMTWHITDLGFRMGLSPNVPEVLAGHVEPLVRQLLARHGHELSDVEGWAVHPGGPRILDVVDQRLGLGPRAMAASRQCLASHGNCSSPTVLLIGEELLRQPGGGPLVLMAFGPGLTLYSALLS